MKGTIKEIAESLSGKGFEVSAANVNGFVKVMEALGKAKVTGEGPKPKRGRVAKVYEIEI
jgi:hypothetical protein